MFERRQTTAKLFIRLISSQNMNNRRGTSLAEWVACVLHMQRSKIKHKNDNDEMTNEIN